MNLPVQVIEKIFLQVNRIMCACEESRPQVGVLIKKGPTLMGSFTLKSLMVIHPPRTAGGILAFSR